MIQACELRLKRTTLRRKTSRGREIPGSSR
jgi:hypothetical protein